MLKTLAFVALTAFVAGAIGPDLALAAPSATEILDANRAATGGTAWDGKATLKVDYAYAGQGMTGKIESLSDLKTPRFVDSYQIGPMSGAMGFDGKQAWEKDPSGTVDVKAGGDTLQLAINDGYRRTNGWWKADRGGAEIASEGEKTDGGTTYDVLTVTPKGGKPFEAWFDAKTHLLARVIEKQGAMPMITKLSDYRDYDAVMLPRVTESVAADGKNQQTQTLTTATFLPAQPETAYAMPVAKVADYSIEGGATETTFPFQLINNHIYAEAKVNGKGPYTFIFDTGGLNLVSPATAEALGLKSEGSMDGRGAGTGTIKAGFTRVKQLTLGKASVDDQLFIVMDLNAMKNIEGIPMPGMVGFETFRRFVTRIDYGAKTITLIDPAKFDAKDAGTPVPFVLNDRVPEVHGSFEGIPAVFDIDTGARDALTLNGPFAKEHDVIAKHPGGFTTVTGWGVGGPSTGYVLRAGSVKLGPVEVQNIVADVNDQKAGAFAGSEYSGNVGGGTLKRFVVTFDYHNKIMYLKPVAGPVADIDTYDRAGMWFNESPQGFEIVAVTKGSPAEAAGLEKADVITAVDGKPAKEIKLYDLRRRLRNDAPGTIVDFTVSRGGEIKDIKVTLKDLI